ncbi:hypothetical protein CYK37_20435 [Mesorhizobium loti]|nr:murein L,D-transpeptidase [Mesorhizobium loti]PLP57497.1 hypothetical protein CYK37_20435 [Mesorhizobium loti]
MKSFAKRSVLLPFAALAATLLGSPHANAEGLFDMLFGGGVRRGSPSVRDGEYGEPYRRPTQRRGEFPPPPNARKAAAIAKITGPTYNTYKADPLVKVDFSSLSAAPQNAAFEPAQAGDAFHEALVGLTNYDLRAEAANAKALTAFYAANPDFIWVTNGEPNERAKQAMRVLGDAATYGLASQDYLVDVPASASTDPATRAEEMIRFEMALSARVLRYVDDAQDGRIDPNRISGYYDFPAKPVDREGALKTLARTQEVGTYLESRHPQNAEYQALRVELEALKASEENEVVVDSKLKLKPGEISPELPKLLSLIARDLDDDMGGDYGEVLARLVTSQDYVPELVPVIKAAQKKAGQKDDGVIGPRTVAALAGASKADRIAKVQYALEELRWHPSELGDPRVFINQPAFSASYIEGGQEKLKTRTVVGKVANQTSFFYDEIEQVDYNPYWGVPQSILVNEMLPRLRRDPGYLDRAGYEVSDSRGKRIPSSSVDWGAYGSKIPFNVRQQPSEANSLGELKILFPNKHAIYMHDTPQKAFFQRDNRALSHGCVRLQDPRGMAAAVLGTSVDYVAGKLAKGHSSEKVSRKIPVYVAYFTAWPDLSGKVEFFDDVYGRDDRLRQALEAVAAVRGPVS